MAPEMFEERYDEMVDVYSFGLCMLELVSGEYPYSECRFPTALMKKIIDGLRPDCYYKVKVECVREIIDCCIRRNKNERLSAKELLKHSFFMESNGLVMETVHPSNRRATLADRIVEFKLKIEDASKRVHSLGQSDALAFKFDVQLDNPEKICAELLEKKLIFEDDVAFVAQSIRDKLRALHYEQLDELEKMSPAVRSLDKPDLSTSNSRVNSLAATIPCLVPSCTMKSPDKVQTVNDEDKEPAGSVDATANPESAVIHQDDLSRQSQRCGNGQLETTRAVAASTQSQVDTQSVTGPDRTAEVGAGRAASANSIKQNAQAPSMSNSLRFHPCNALNIQEAALIAANVASNRFTVVPHSMKTGELEFTSGDRSDDQVYGIQSIKLSQIKRVQITVISIEKNQVKCLFEIPGVFIEFLFDRARFKPEIVGSVLSSMIVKRSKKEDIDHYKIPLTMSCIECLTNIVKSIGPSSSGDKTFISGAKVFSSEVRQNNNIENLNAEELVDSIKRTPSSYKQSFVVSKMNVDKNMIGAAPMEVLASNGSNSTRSKDATFRDRLTQPPTVTAAPGDMTDAHLSSGGGSQSANKLSEQSAVANAPDSVELGQNRLPTVSPRKDGIMPQTPMSPPLAAAIGSCCASKSAGCASAKLEGHADQRVNAEDSHESNIQRNAAAPVTGVQGHDRSHVHLSGPATQSPPHCNTEQPSPVASDARDTVPTIAQGRHPASDTSKVNNSVSSSSNVETGSGRCSGAVDKVASSEARPSESGPVATGLSGRSENQAANIPPRGKAAEVTVALSTARIAPQQPKPLPTAPTTANMEGAVTGHTSETLGQAVPSAVKPKSQKAMLQPTEECKVNVGTNGKEAQANKPCTSNLDASLSVGLVGGSTLLSAHVKSAAAELPSVESDAVKTSKSAGYQQDLQQLDKNLKQALGRPKPTDSAGSSATSDQKDMSKERTPTDLSKPVLDSAEKQPCNDEGQRHGVVDPALINETRTHNNKGHRPRVGSGTLNVAEAGSLCPKSNVPCEVGKLTAATASKPRPAAGGVQVKDRFTVIPLGSDMAAPSVKGTNTGIQGNSRSFNAQPSACPAPVKTAVQGSDSRVSSRTEHSGGKRQAGTQTSIDSPYLQPQMGSHSFLLPCARQAHHCGQCFGGAAAGKAVDYTCWLPGGESVPQAFSRQDASQDLPSGRISQKRYSEESAEFLVPQVTNRRSVKIVDGHEDCSLRGYNQSQRIGSEDQARWSLAGACNRLPSSRPISTLESGDKHFNDERPIFRCAECKGAVATDENLLQQRAALSGSNPVFFFDDCCRDHANCRCRQPFRIQQSMGNAALVDGSKMLEQTTCRVPRSVLSNALIAQHPCCDAYLADGMMRADPDETHISPCLGVDYRSTLLGPNMSGSASCPCGASHPHCHAHRCGGQSNNDDHFGTFVPSSYDHTEVPTRGFYLPRVLERSQQPFTDRSFSQPPAKQEQIALHQLPWRFAYDLIDRQRQELYYLLSGHRQQIDGLLKALSTGVPADGRVSYIVPNCSCEAHRRRLPYQFQLDHGYRRPSVNDASLANTYDRHCVDSLPTARRSCPYDRAAGQEFRDDSGPRQVRQCYSQIQPQCESVDDAAFGLCPDRCLYRGSTQSRNGTGCNRRGVH